MRFENLQLVLSGYKNWKIVAFGDLNDQRFAGAFLDEVGSKLLSQKTGVGADNTIFAGIVARVAFKYFNPNLLFRCVFRSLPDIAQSAV